MSDWWITPPLDLEKLIEFKFKPMSKLLRTAKVAELEEEILKEHTNLSGNIEFGLSSGYTDNDFMELADRLHEKGWYLLGSKEQCYLSKIAPESVMAAKRVQGIVPGIPSEAERVTKPAKADTVSQFKDPKAIRVTGEDRCPNCCGELMRKGNRVWCPVCDISGESEDTRLLEDDH